MNDDEQDAKELLGRAFGQEPALGIDRDEVFRAGRKRLRRRRVLASSGVVAVVVVAAVGAVTLTGLPDTPPDAPPAATRTAPTPGPDLPTTTTSDVQTPVLNELFNGSGILQAARGSNPEAFRGGGYVYEGDILIADRKGSLRITIKHAPGTKVDCADIDSVDLCEILTSRNREWLQATSHGSNGARTNLVSVVLRNGMKVTAVASNKTIFEEKDGEEPLSEPVLDMEGLSVLIAKLDAG